jgi:hypothetical protein
MLFRIIDTILFDASWIHRHPELAERGEGVMAILDPDQIKEAPAIRDRMLAIHKPDGSVAQVLAGGSEVHHSAVGIFFPAASSDHIPRGSELEW